MQDEFSAFSFEFSGVVKQVHRSGADARPAVLLIQELPGITHHTIALARRLHEDGFTVYLPALFGGFDSPFEPFRNLARICVQREFHLLALNKPSLVSDWLRALCRLMRERSGGRVGAIGMCFTGSFVVSLMVDDAVAAPVMSQPGHARGFFTHANKRNIGVPDTHLKQAAERAASGNVQVLGLRFTKDVMCPPERFEHMEEIFGDNFLRVDIDSSFGNPHGIPILAHSVLTIDYKDQAEHPTRQAYERVVSFLQERLCRK